MRTLYRQLSIGTVCLLALSACTEPNSQPVEVLDENGASLGSVALTVRCSTEATTLVRRGLAMLHNMTYEKAAADFASAAEQDPSCVLARWGQAIALFHPLWPDVPSDDVLRRGEQILAQARELDASERESAYLSALEAYFVGSEGRSEAERLQRYASAWGDVAETYPDDPEARLFQALATIAIAGGSENRTETSARGGQIAETVLASVPDHPGALHYVIHAYDSPELAQRGLDAARSYGKVAPENAHALHMTSHIFTRVGSWQESIDYNVRAAAAGRSNPMGGAVSMHYLHAADYLVYAHLQRGEDESARKVWEDLQAIDGPIHNHAASAYAYAAIPARLALERQDWTAASNIAPRSPDTIQWEQYPHLEAIVEFARGIGSARSQSLADAAAAVARLEELESEARALPGAYDWGTQVEIQREALEAWIEFEEGDRDSALASMEAAAALEATTIKNPVTPGEVLPAAELLGDLLLAMERPTEAVDAYRTALARTPNRLNSLYGAGLGSEMAGDEEAAAQYFEQLVSVTNAEASLDALVRARAGG